MKFAAPVVSHGLADVIPAGKLAVSFEINEFTAASGMLIPGDHIDVLVTLSAKAAGKDLTEIILQNIDVLAVAQTYVGENISNPSHRLPSKLPRTQSRAPRQVRRPLRPHRPRTRGSTGASFFLAAISCHPTGAKTVTVALLPNKPSG